ncbi:T9SS type A sorting domain-containing protein [Changchengzhania lutea]|uniref:T9SS type A sorting domain-containing protein n=1 Tax=Changchengzhania lutea TaxID=2049305 RepID=UPI00115C7754|nr:T9SS type A sorting domain-containing protein [Changchengzhania lutea]
MLKNYAFTLILTLTCLISQHGFSQDGVRNTAMQQHNIEGLTIYPNPVNNGRQFINITSKLHLTKTVEFYNVLGKKIFSTVMVGKELNISKFSTGVYILKITENNISETRKLVIK